MSTDSLDQAALDNAAAAAMAAAADVRAKHQEALREAADIANQRATHAENFRVVAAATDRRLQDDAARVGERLLQLGPIVGAGPVPDQPATTPPAAGNGNGANGGDTQVQPAVQPAPTPVRNDNGYSFLPQNLRHGLFCVIGAVIGFLFGTATRSVTWHKPFYTSLQDPGSGHNLAVAIWVILWTVFGFAIGGLAYYWRQNRHRREH